MAIILLALGDCVFGLSLTSIPFSILAAIGFIALSGIARLNRVVLVDYFNELSRKGDNPKQKWLVEGTELRLRAALMTTLVDMFVFYSNGYFDRVWSRSSEAACNGCY